MVLLKDSKIHTLDKDKQIAFLMQENERLKSRQKYGLVWEDHAEELDNKNVIPLLDLREDLSLPKIEGKPDNYLIEGDNYHALKALQHTHKGLVDVIYIDPPYNTGNQDFVYNDKMVDSEDGFRHSKWLSFMEKRLKLARNLMSDDGVIFVSIDDNEQAQLKLLMDSVFGEQNFINTFHWKSTGQQQNNGKNIATVTEYILVYSKIKLDSTMRVKDIIIGDKMTNRKGLKSYSKEDDKGKFRLNPIQDRSLGKHSYALTHPISGNIIKSDNWRINKESLLELESQDMIYWTEKLPNVKKYLDINQRVLVSNYIDGIYNEHSNSEIRSIFGNKVFDYAKPIKLIKFLIDILDNPYAIVLDFFAGSGTTAHSVMELNKEDGGNRSFIMCTNNEVSDENERNYLFEQNLIPKNNKTEYNKYRKDNPIDYQIFLDSNEYQELGIARAVTRERIKRVIEGYTTTKGLEVEGIPNNLTYLQTLELPIDEEGSERHNNSYTIRPQKATT